MDVMSWCWNKHSINDFSASLLYSRLFINRIWRLKENQRANINYSDIDVPRKIHVLSEAQHTRFITNGFATWHRAARSGLSFIQQVENSFARLVVIIM